MGSRTLIKLAHNWWIAVVAALIWLLATTGVVGQEIAPAVGDLRISRGALSLNVRLNAEAYFLGLDPEAVSGVDATASSAEYLDLRALQPDALKRRLSEAGPAWVPDVRIEVDGTVVPLTVSDIQIGAVGDMRLPRTSQITLTGTVPQDASVFMVSWPRGAGTLVLRQQRVSTPFSGYVDGGHSSPLIYVRGGGEVKSRDTFNRYLQNGFVSILPNGPDHVLFILALFFLSAGVRPLLWQIGVFALAHSATLAAGTLGWIGVPVGFVEPLIAISLVYAALDNTLSRRLSRLRLGAVFISGLVHGLGLASDLAMYDPLPVQTLPALLGFNTGVEIGQFAVIAIAFAGVGYWFRSKPWYRPFVALPVSIFIAAVGAYWFAASAFY